MARLLSRIARLERIVSKIGNSMQIKKESPEVRGTGRTTSQIQAAPTGSAYVWCNDALAYPKALAQKLGRRDLLIVGPAYVNAGCWRGSPRRVVIDHAIEPTQEQAAELRIHHAMLDEVEDGSAVSPMTNDNWILGAIEAEADRRASNRFFNGDNVRVLGLSVRQIMWLRNDWQARTGKSPEEIPE